jgi:rhodanese-related sulfurtransferase
MSYTPILYRKLRELLAEGAQLVEVLPAAEYDELHLPGAISIPLKNARCTHHRRSGPRQGRHRVLLGRAV